MKIAMIGTGYVGLVSGVCFSDFGHEVVCVDKNPTKIEMLERGEVPIYEPGLDALMERNVAAGRLSFTGNLAEAVADADAVFIAVGTPTRRGDGHADLTYVYAAAEEVAQSLKSYAVIVTKSTVPVGTNREVERIVREARPDLEFDVASNPEFLREGAAIDDFMRPDRVVVGVETERAREIMGEVYRPLFLRDFPIVFTDLESAEMIKYAANAFLQGPVVRDLMGLSLRGSAVEGGHLHLAGGEVALEVGAVVNGIPQAELHIAEHIQLFYGIRLIFQSQAVQLTGIAGGHEQLLRSGNTVLLTLQNGIAQTVAAGVAVQLCLGGLPAGVPDGIAILDVNVVAVHIQRGAVIAVAGQAAHPRIAVKAVAARRI